MKRIMKSILALLLLVVLAGNAKCLPWTMADMTKIYGNPKAGTLPDTSVRLPGPQAATVFSQDDIAISYDGVVLDFKRDTPFSELEIPDLLKPLSPGEKWVDAGKGDWVLPKAKCKAHWNGEGKIHVESF